MRLLLRWIGLAACAFVALQLFFAARIALMARVDPESTAFQRSQAWQIASGTGRLPWRQRWVDYARISDHLKRAVIASEDGDFINHDGVEWDAIEQARRRNTRAEEIAERRARAEEEAAARRARTARPGASAAARPARPPKVVGGSTITQQLAKNLLLSGERTLLRKGQELMLALLLERLVGKRRILELYLNSVEWGEGVFGAEAASQHYFRKGAAQLTPYEAARLAVMLPRPKHYEKLSNSGYLAGRAQTIVARMGDARLP